MNENASTATDRDRFEQAMAELGVTAFDGLAPNGCTNRDRAQASKAYRDFLMNQHPDKNGGQRMDDPEKLHKVMEARRHINSWSVPYRATAAEAIDLSQGDSDSDSDSDDTPDDLSDGQGGEGLDDIEGGEQALGPPSGVVPDDEGHPLLLLLPAIAGVADDQAGGGLDDLVGRSVSDRFWFEGTVKDVVDFRPQGKRTGPGSSAPIFQISYDDGDSEQLYIEEYRELPRSNCEANLKPWHTGYSFHKEFEIEGIVSKRCSGNGEQYRFHAIFLQC